MYKTVAGDTFELIARKVYGSELESSRIAAANPGVNEPLVVGIDLIIPIIAGAPSNLQQSATANNVNETAILINGVRFRFWDKVKITRSIDTFSTVEFSAPFQADAEGFKEIFKPFSYKSIVVTVGGDPIFTGTIIAINPVLENKQKIISVSCYSIPGVLNDCTPPAASFPLEFNGQGLKEIITTLALPFGITVNFEVDQGAIFERVATDPTKKILAFIVDLVKQRNLILTNDELGALVVLQSIAEGEPVARLVQGESPLLSVTPTFNPQGYHSHITGIETVAAGLQGSQFTVKNPRLAGVLRPLTVKFPDVIDSTVKQATDAKMGRMFGSLVSYTVKVSTWRTSIGELWQPNTMVMLLSPDAMVYNEYKFLIRSVSFDKDSKTETATLNLVLIGSFSGDTPNSLPWD